MTAPSNVNAPGNASLNSKYVQQGAQMAINVGMKAAISGGMNGNDRAQSIIGRAN